MQGLVEKQNQHLEEVELDGAEISDSGVEQLSYCKQLKHLGISFCECLTDQSLEYIKVKIVRISSCRANHFL